MTCACERCCVHGSVGDAARHGVRWSAVRSVGTASRAGAQTQPEGAQSASDDSWSRFGAPYPPLKTCTAWQRAPTTVSVSMNDTRGPGHLLHSCPLSFSNAHVGRGVHYDAQAGHHRSRGEALAVRNAGALIAYKKFANGVKRRMISEYFPGARCSSTLAVAWAATSTSGSDAKVRHVVAMGPHRRTTQRSEDARDA